MLDPLTLDPHSDGLSPIALQRLRERFPNGIEASVAVTQADVNRLTESSVRLLEPISVSVTFNGKDQLELSFHAHLSADCTRCMGLVDRRFELSPRIALFETADQADRAMMADPDLDAVATEDHRDFLELIEDEILLEIGHGLVHSDCRPSLGAETDRPRPFQDLAQLLSMKKPS